MALTKVSTDGVKDDAITSGKIPANAVGTSELADNAVTAGKTSGVQTTINNNADNRVITGSGTANTLNGESNVVIDSNGQLGVGTTSPGQLFSLKNTSSQCQQSLTAATNGSCAIYFGDTDSVNRSTILHHNTGDYLSLGTAATERMRIDSSGNVGVNITSPIVKFHVRGDSSNNGSVVLEPDSGKGSNISHIHYGSTGDWYIRPASSSGYIRHDIGKSIFTNGILFGSDTAAANTLDDYEEGTWTPQIQGTSGAGTASYNTQRGRYLKVGNLVYLTGYCGWTSGSAGGELRVTDLPFSALSNSEGIGSCMLHSISFQSGSSPVVLYLGGGTNYTYFYQSRDNNSWISLNYDDAGYIIFNVTYRVA